MRCEQVFWTDRLQDGEPRQYRCDRRVKVGTRPVLPATRLLRLDMHCDANGQLVWRQFAYCNQCAEHMTRIWPGNWQELDSDLIDIVEVHDEN